MSESPLFTLQVPVTVRGVIHGKTITLESPLDLPDGEMVELQLRVARDPKRSLEALLKLSGAFANDPKSDADFEWLERERKSNSPRDLDP